MLRSKRAVAAPNNNNAASLQQQQHAQPDQALIDLERQRQQEAEAEKLRIQQQQEQERHAKEQLELSSSLFPLTSSDPDSSFQTRVAQIGEILNAAAEFPNNSNNKYTTVPSFSNSTKSWYSRSYAHNNDDTAPVVTMPRNLGDLKIKPLISPPNASSAPTNRIVVDLQHLNWQIFPADKQFKICRDLCKAVEVAGKRAAVAVTNNNNNNNNGFAQNVAWNSVRFCRRGEMLTHCVVDFLNVEVATVVQRVLTDVRYKATFGEVAISPSSVLGTTLIVTDFAQRLHGGSGLEISDVFKMFAEPLQSFSRKQQENNNNNIQEVSVIPSFEAGVFFVCFKDTKFINALLHCSFSKEILSSLILDCGILISLTDTDDSDFYSPSKIVNVVDKSFLSGSGNQNNGGSSVHYQEQQALFFNNNNNNNNNVNNNFPFQHHHNHFGIFVPNNNINANTSRFGAYPDAPVKNTATVPRGGLLDDDLALAEIDGSSSSNNNNNNTRLANNHESFLIFGSEINKADQESKVDEDDDGANNNKIIKTQHVPNSAPLFDAPPPSSLHAVPAGFNQQPTQQQQQYQHHNHHHHHHHNEFQYQQQQQPHHQYQQPTATTMPLAPSATAANPNTLINGIPYYAVRCNSIDETMAIFDRLLEIDDTRFWAKMLSHPPIFDFRVKNPMLIEINNKRFPRLLQLLTRADVLMEMLTNTTNGALAITTNWIHTNELKEGISKIVVSLLTKASIAAPLTPVLVEMMKSLAPSDSASAILQRALPQTPSDVEASFLEEHQDLVDRFNNNKSGNAVVSRPFFAVLLQESPQYSSNICKLLQLCHQDHAEILKQLLFGGTSTLESQKKADHDDDDDDDGVAVSTFSSELEQRRKYYNSLLDEDDDKNETTIKNFGNVLRSVLNSRAKTLGGSIPEFLQGLINDNKIVSNSFLSLFEAVAGIHIISEVEESFIRFLVSKMDSPSTISTDENDQKHGALPTSDKDQDNNNKIYSFLQRIAPKLCQDTIKLLIQLATTSSSSSSSSSTAFHDTDIQAWSALVESGVNAKPHFEESSSGGLLGPAPVPQQAGFRAILIPPHSASSIVTAATTEKTSHLPRGHPSIETIKETLAKTLPQNWASEFEQYPKLGIPFALLPIGWKVVPDESTGLYKFSFLKPQQQNYHHHQQQHHFHYRQPPPIITTTTHHPTANREYKVTPQQFFYSNKFNPSIMFALDSTLNEGKFQEWLQDQSIRNETMDSYTIWKANVKYPEKYETQMKSQNNSNNNNNDNSSSESDPVQVNAATRRNRSNSPNGNQEQNAEDNDNAKNDTASVVVTESLFLSSEAALPKLAEWFKLYPASGTPFPANNFIKISINNARGMYTFISNNNNASSSSFHPQTRREYRATPQAIFDQDKTADVKQFCRENNLQILKFRGYLADQRLRDDEIDKVILEKYDVKYLS